MYNTLYTVENFFNQYSYGVFCYIKHINYLHSNCKLSCVTIGVLKEAIIFNAMEVEVILIYSFKFVVLFNLNKKNWSS